MISTLAFLAASAFPTSPAADALGADPASVSRPASGATLGAEILGVIGTDGQMKPGVAIEFAPLWMIVGDEFTLHDWRRSVPGRLASWTYLSLATSRATDGSVEMAEGLKIVVIDGGDLRWDDAYAACVGRITAGFQEGWDQEWDTPIVTGAAKEALAACAEEAKRRARSAAGDGLAIAFATVHRTGEAELRRGYVTLSGSANLGRWTELVGSARYENDWAERTAALLVGAKLRARSDRGVLALDLSSQIAESATIALQLEARIYESAWLVVNAGGRIDFDGWRPDAFTGLSLRYAFGSEP